MSKLITKKLTLGRLESSEEFKEKKTKIIKKKEEIIESLKISVRDINDQDISSRNLNKKTNYLTLSKYFIVALSIVAFGIASKGFSVLYLFLLADLFCCAFVLTVFYSFYNKKLNEKTAYISIIIGLIGGFLLYPAPDFSKSLLVGVILPADTFPAFVSQSLLFLSFITATFLPVIFWKIKGSKK